MYTSKLNCKQNKGNRSFRYDTSLVGYYFVCPSQKELERQQLKLEKYGRKTTGSLQHQQQQIGSQPKLESVSSGAYCYPLT